MPGEGSKRKQALTGGPPAKRQRPSGSDANEMDANAKILLMEQGIQESKKNYNDITVLLSAARDGGEVAMLAAVALCRVFVRLLAQGCRLVFKHYQSEKDRIVASWLRDQLFQYKRLLLDLLKDEELAVTALTLCMRILKAEGEGLSENQESSFPAAFAEDLVRAIALSDHEHVRRAYIEEYAEQFDDIRYHTFKSVKPVVESVVPGQGASGTIFARVFSLISALDGVPGSADDLEDFYISRPRKKSHPLRSVTQHKKQGQEAWLALINTIDSKDQRKLILEIMSTVVAPWFTKPELLADFLADCYNTGGSLSLLALSGVFYLINERNLDYPSFYPKLYSLLDRDILHSKHRARFFRLLDTFLASSHLPAALVASFLKRLARLALNAPPSAIAFVVPWIYNLLVRHPTCTFMLHRVTRDRGMNQHVREGGFEDPFMPEEPDPMETKAIDSCLWELVQLQSHYHPNIATIAKIVSEQFTKHSYNIEDFLDHSYASLLEAEMDKDVKKAPVVEFHIPKKVFVAQEAPGATPDSLLVRLWDFGEAPGSTGVA